MEEHRSKSTPRVRRSRAEQKRETREALIQAALAAFTRDGYHGANLEEIANEAGFSKGAVYSNFGGKAELFLAVMDYNMETMRGQGWDPFAMPKTCDPDQPESNAARAQEAAEIQEATEALRRFGLATLEFIATAARDDTLRHALRARVQTLLDAYGQVAAAGRPAGENLPVEDVARLMAALDQGASLLLLSGIPFDNDELVRTGLRRLLDPASAAHEPAPARAGHASPDIERIRQLIHDAPASDRSARDA